MITVGFSTRQHNQDFIDYLRNSSGNKKIEIIEKVNNGEKSLPEIYNEILNESSNDIVILCHDDIYFDTSSWANKIIKHFEKSEFGILGVAGTTELTESGRWWDKQQKMVGIVNHEHNNKKWESKYSESFNNDIIETLIIDGLFMAIHKPKLKTFFDTDFKGFHFYDISFTFKNFLEGVKVGVITNIRITHKSIGMTNEQWEKNRLLFVDKFNSNLPYKLPFNSKRKLKVLISCLFFKTFTGSELYVYELAKELIKLNCDVTILSNIGGPLTNMAKNLGIKCFSLDEPPGYKKGDGKWILNTPNGQLISQPNRLYKINDVKYDIIHIQHKPVAETIIGLYPNINKIYTIHSEVINLEHPIKDKSIKKYIAIRPEIKDFLINKFEIPENSISVIYNPIDNEKFKSKNTTNENYILFVGTIDYLRKQTIYDLLEESKNNGQQLYLVGENKDNYLPDLLKEPNVKYFPPTWNVEKYIQKSLCTASVQLGRTLIESWLCGKPGWIYKIDESGNILEKNLTQPPQDIDKFYSSTVAKNILNEYIDIINQ